MKSVLCWRKSLLSRLTAVAMAGAAVTALVMAVAACSQTTRGPEAFDVIFQALAAATKTRGAEDHAIARNAMALLEKGRAVFRYETFGGEAWWTDTLQLHKAVAGERHGGLGGGVGPAAALAVGLKVDVDALPASLREDIRDGKVDLHDPAVTLALLGLDAIVGVKATLGDDGSSIRQLGVTCALCHSTVDDSFAPGIGHRRDGWPNRDLDVGLIVSLARDVQSDADLLGTDVRTVRTVIPPAHGLAGGNLHTRTGSGSVTCGNACVAATQMHGTEATSVPRPSDPVRHSVAARSGSWDTRGRDPADASAKLDALRFYQLSIPAPAPPAGSSGAFCRSDTRPALRQPPRWHAC